MPPLHAAAAVPLPLHLCTSALAFGLVWSDLMARAAVARWLAGSLGRWVAGWLVCCAVEDLDAAAGNIAARHCRDAIAASGGQMMLVTASVDRIEMRHRANIHSNMTLSGNVAWVGRSSMVRPPTLCLSLPALLCTYLRLRLRLRLRALIESDPLCGCCDGRKFT